MVHIGYNSYAVTGLLVECWNQFQRSVLLKQWTNLLAWTTWILKYIHTYIHTYILCAHLYVESQRKGAVCKGIRRIWIHVAEKQTKRAIKELCNKGQVNQRNPIVTLHPQFDQTKRLQVVACHSGTETTLAFLREHFLAHTRTKWGKESFEKVSNV